MRQLLVLLSCMLLVLVLVLFTLLYQLSEFLDARPNANAQPETQDVVIPLQANTPGQRIFKANCASCHKMTSQRQIGPGLAGVLDRWGNDTTEIIRYVQYGAQGYALGNFPKSEYIKGLIQEYGVVMPPQPFSPEDAKQLFDYLRSSNL